MPILEKKEREHQILLLHIFPLAKQIYPFLTFRVHPRDKSHSWLYQTNYYRFISSRAYFFIFIIKIEKIAIKIML